METLQRAANRGSVPTGYDIDNSLKFEADNTEYLSHSSSGGSGTKVTYSFWCKRTELDSSSYMQVSGISTSSETVRFMFYQDSVRVDAGNSSTGKILVTNRKFRDTSAWYHFFVVIDTTLATEGDRHQLYVNGVRETSFSTEQYPTQNFSVATDQSNATWRYGAYDSTYYKFSGYLAECYRLDGIAASCTDFGEFDSDSGIWIPKEYTGSFGSNGHYLDFEDSSSLGADDSGNGNNFTLNNIAAADQSTDTPTNNFCTLNVNWKYANVPSVANCTDGGTIIQHNGSWSGAKATMGVQNGKWYWECKIGQRENTMWGIQTDGEDNIASGNAQNNKSTNVLYSADSSGGYTIHYNSGSIVAPATNRSAVWSPGDIAGIALDMDNNTITYTRNGSALASHFTDFALYDNANKVNFPFIATYREYIKINFGGYSDWETGGNSDANGYGSFQYSVPSGYYALCTKNLAEYG